VLSGRTLDEVRADPEGAVWSSVEGASQPLAGRPGDPADLPGARRRPLPEKLLPQLATLVDTPPEGAWLSEIKLDGYRLLAEKDGDQVRLRTRRGLDWTARFPAVARAVAALPAR